ncbi:beta-1,3-galactosyltransferase 1 isoform X2 [Hydra vulgaris]|uniref:Hexosyltransferase n=1 Tax=Hydra vulgaris TaxID=6087 RepID=A0ABM4CPD3_HYDVU
MFRNILEKSFKRKKFVFLFLFLLICVLLKQYCNKEIIKFSYTRPLLPFQSYVAELESMYFEAQREYYHVYKKQFKPIAQSINNKNEFQNNKLKTIQPKCRTPLSFLILVHSSAENIKRRLAIRYSWGSPQNRFNKQLTSNLTYSTVFAVGRSLSTAVNKMIAQEASLYSDILFIDILDTYRNLSYKTLNSLIWSSNYCRPNFLLKTDDDCYVNVVNILNFLKSEPLLPLYTGRVQWFMPPNRDNTSKFYISVNDYNAFLLPPYVSGGGILLSGDLIPRLVSASQQKKIIPNEDANLGILMNNIGVLPRENIHILPFIYCNDSIWNRPTCDFVDQYVIHGVENYSQVWLHYHTLVLQNIKGICSLVNKFRQYLKPPLYCPTDNSV